MRWRQFAEAAEELAGLGVELIAEKHILLLGTLRPDGSPRISAVECDLAGDDLCIGMIWRSTKALDLLRDPRTTAHSLPAGLANPGGDLKLYGRAVPVEGEQKRAYGQTIYARLQWEPEEPYHCFALDLESAGFVKFRDGGREVISWRAGEEPRRDFRAAMPTT
jgi:hypothetical protein